MTVVIGVGANQKKAGGNRYYDSDLSICQDDRFRRPCVFLLQRFVRKVADNIGGNNGSLPNSLPKLLLFRPVHDVASSKHRWMAEDLELGRDTDILLLGEYVCTKR